MIIQCNSCDKKFVVPDTAINKNGRVVQCGSCGNKWTQYPQSNRITKLAKTKDAVKKKSVTKKNKKSSVAHKYTSEYLKKKYGLDLNTIQTAKDKNIAIQSNQGIGFYGYFIFLIVFFLTLFGILELTKDFIFSNYPVASSYIENIYETLENLFLIFRNLI